MFVIVRHGNTFAPGEPPRRIGARTDLPLTPVGMAQGEALGARFAELGWRFARALISPLLRTRETARLILDRQDAPPPIEICEWLREIDHGPDEDQPEEAVRARIGAKALARWDERAEPPPGWIVDIEARLRGWRALFDEVGSQSGPTLVVTSNGAARFALLCDPALAATIPELTSLKLTTGGYGTIRRTEGGALEVSEWGLRP